MTALAIFLRGLGWIVVGVIIGAGFVAAYNLSPWLLVIILALITAACVALGTVDGERR